MALLCADAAGGSRAEEVPVDQTRPFPVVSLECML